MTVIHIKLHEDLPLGGRGVKHWSDKMTCQCGKSFRSYAAEAFHRHNFPALCRQPKRKTSMRGHSAGFKFQESDNQFSASIPKDQWEALMKINDGFDYERAAAELNIKIGTLKSRINRAREKILHLRTKQTPGIIASEERAP